MKILVMMFAVIAVTGFSATPSSVKKWKGADYQYTKSELKACTNPEWNACLWEDSHKQAAFAACLNWVASCEAHDLEN